MAEKRILVIDDDRELLQELKEMLEGAGYDITAVGDGFSAVNAAKAIRPDLILLDLRMEAMSGFEVADRLKGFSQTHRIPVVAMTGYYTLKEHSWLMNFCGIKRCIRKPFHPLDVIAEIEDVLKEVN